MNYYNGNSAYKFTWKDGRRLATATKGGIKYSFNYNDEGIRTSKTVGGVEHTYILNGSQIVSEQWDNKLMAFVYDESGAPIAIHYRLNGSAENVFYTYYLEKNLQGDIIALYNSSGTKLVGYTYDAWGNCTTTYYNNGGSTGAQYNPFRYRGYYYDADLGLYYLNSRYYDSNTGRFINADGQLNGGLLGYNQYAYCENSPIMQSDPMGNYAKDHKMVTYAPGTSSWRRPVYYEEKNAFLVFVKQMFDDCDNLNLSNKNPEAVFKANYFSCYKGKLVIIHSIENLASCSIFNTIILSRNDRNTKLLNHEYGHSLQEEQLGTFNYLFFVAIPSVTYFCVSRDNKQLKNIYYSMPWEYKADQMGQVNRDNYCSWADEISDWYFKMFD